ncbi:MAG TPA: hypothetical protein VNC84_07900 [Gammaproteobacteria bacterium]|nr:hypothetical protein [Gammaproteobacteria bacterium]
MSDKLFVLFDIPFICPVGHLLPEGEDMRSLALEMNRYSIYA